MCGGASKVVVRELNIPDDLKTRLVTHGLGTAQDVLDEGSASLAEIGCSETDIAGLSEAIDRECGQRID